MAKITFFIHSPGDPSVGLWPIDAEVIVSDNMVWSHDMIDEAKKYLAGLYDTKKESVATEREMILNTIAEGKREIYLIESELHDGMEEEEYDKFKRDISNREKQIKKLEKKLLDGGLI
jgi:predicted RNase H-like nuclease (RuvC/YqgF family)